MFLAHMDIDIFGESSPVLIALLEFLGLLDDVVCADILVWVPEVAGWIVLRLNCPVLVDLVYLYQLTAVLVELLHLIDVGVE